MEVACKQLGFSGGEWYFWHLHLNDTVQILYEEPGNKVKLFIYDVYSIREEFHNLSWYPYIDMRIFGGILNLCNRYTDRRIVIIGGTHGTNLWHPNVLRHSAAPVEKL